MTTMNEAVQAMNALVHTTWTGIDASYGITFQNQAGYNPPANIPWCRVSVIHTAATQETLGPVSGRRFARFGNLIAQIFVDRGTGATEARTLASTVQNALEGVSISGTTVRFRDVAVREIGDTDAWWQINVDAAFEYDERK